MGRQKTNPRRISATQADVRRAEKDAVRRTFSNTAVLFLTVLRDKEGYGPKRLQRIWDEINNLAESINQGYVSTYDLSKTLKDEAEIVLTFGEE